MIIKSKIFKMASGKGMSGLGFVAAIMISSFLIGLIFSTVVYSEENTMTTWKTSTLCSYDAKSNVSPKYSGCVKLSNVISIYSSKNFVFVAAKNAELRSVDLYVIDPNYENLIDNKFIYDGSPTKIVRYKAKISFAGESMPTICAGGRYFAYGTPSSKIMIYDGKANSKTGNKILEGKPSSCDINGENLAVCTTRKAYVMDMQGNIKWSKDMNKCKKVKILNDKVFVASNDKFLVFSMNGDKIFSKNISVKDMGGTDKIAIATSDGIYTYEEDLNALDKLVDDTAVIGIAGLNNAIAYITPSTLKVVNYDKKVISKHVMKPNTHLVSIKGNKNYAIASTDVADPDTILIDISKGNVDYAVTKASDVTSKIRQSYLKDGMFISLLPYDEILFKNLVGISAQEAIKKGENILNEVKDMGATDAEKKQISDTLNEMKNAFKEGNYAKVMEIGKNLQTQAAKIGNSYTLQEKQLTDNLLEMASEEGMLLTTGIKLKYDNAIEKMQAGNYKGAVDDFKQVRTETEQYVRDKALELLKDVKDRKSALDKFAESTEEITKLDEQIDSEKDYVNAFTLLKDVKKLDDLTKERMKELFDEAEKAKEEAITPWLMFGADVTDIKEKIRDAHIAEYEGKYETALKKLSEATKEAHDFDTISKAKDIAVISIIVGVIVLIILYIRRPKVKEE